ncbi:hypothetical protein E2C01_053044 [Portunus trituberculatus]|uniref:Uncharacterized protein n=1 Tax=Portunus trituberculatus TaxID=210409 RepID=A0A5B7GN46_PORTR|nr:hypothetical protein [Portunus trituberculatus]
MAPKRLISGENKESGESESVSEPQPSTSGFTGITPGKMLQRHFHLNWSSDDLHSPLTLLPSSSTLSITSLRLRGEGQPRTKVFKKKGIIILYAHTLP